MKRNLLYTMMITIMAIILSSCSDSEKKYKHFAQQVPIAIAAIDVIGSTDMTPDKFYRLIADKFDKSDAQRVDNGMAALFKWKNDGEYVLSGNEDFYCCAMFNFDRNAYELTISDFQIVYESSSAENLDSYYSVAMSELEPMLERWGYNLNDNLAESNCNYYIKDNAMITVRKENNQIAISQTFR